MHTSLLFHFSRQSVKTIPHEVHQENKKDWGEKFQREHQLPMGQHQADYMCNSSLTKGLEGYGTGAETEKNS